MPFFTDNIRAGSSGAVTGYEIERSIRLSRSDNAKLSKTFSSAGNRRKWTFSVWAKFPDTNDSNTNQIFSYQQGHVNHRGSFYKGSSGVLNYQLRVAGSRKAFVTTVTQLRDPSAWYHIVLVIDSDQGSSSNRVKIYINGDLQDVTYYDTPTSGFDTWINSTQTLYFGAAADENGGNMYLADINFIDGQAYDPSYFAETNSDTGQWVPIEYAGSYTGNSFYLKFDDNSNNTSTTLGKDSSGLGNNWTPTNLSTYDAVKDTPTNNFCTFNVLTNYDSLTLAQGSLKATATSTWDMVRSTMGVSSGKWYFEVRCNAAPDNEGWMAGIHEVFGRDNDGYWIYNGTYTAANYGYAYAVQDNNQRRKNATGDDAFDTGDIQPGDVVGIRMDLDNNELLISVNGSDKGKMYDIQSGITYAPFVDLYSGASATLNCGQDSTFHGGEAAGGNTDANGIGDFKYAVPSGYKAICSANLPDPTILLPNKYFAAFTYTGTGSSGDVVNITNSNVDFTPNWVWVKTRTVTNDHILSDSVRGGSKFLVSSEPYAEQTDTDKIRAFIQNGFESGTDGDTNWPSRTFVAWNWKEDTTAGFDIVLHNVNSTGSDFTISHGLGVTPAAIFAKNRDASHSWRVFHQKIGVSQTEFLDSYGSPSGNANRVRAVSSSNFTFRTNTSGNFVFYVFSEVANFSKFGKYYGNNQNDGTMVNCGFRPAFLIVKRIDSDRDWIMYDNARGTTNPIKIFLEPNRATSDQTSSSNSVDFVSNGFKFRNNSGDMNGAGEYIYFAWAESPFKNANAR